MRGVAGARACVAATRAAIVATGDNYGVENFCSLYGRDADRWHNLRAALLEYLGTRGFRETRNQQRSARFRVEDVVVLPNGGFMLIHAAGVTLVSDAAEFVNTRDWPAPLGRWSGVVAADADPRGDVVWVVGHHDGGGRLVRVPIDPDGLLVVHALPPGVHWPAFVRCDEDGRLLGGDVGTTDIVMLPRP